MCYTPLEARQKFGNYQKLQLSALVVVVVSTVTKNQGKCFGLVLEMQDMATECNVQKYRRRKWSK